MTETPLHIEDLRKVEEELSNMHMSKIYTSMNLATGNICIDIIEIRDKFGGSPARLSVDEKGELRVYPTMDLNCIDPMTVQTWGIHKRNK